MLIKIKYGGTGNIKTTALERAQEAIIRCRTSGASATIDSNMVMAMITEILEKRAKASEFILESTDSIDVADSYIAEDDDELDFKEPPRLDERFKTKASTKNYWLDDSKKRRTTAVALSLVIAVIVIFLALAYA